MENPIPEAGAAPSGAGTATQDRSDWAADTSRVGNLIRARVIDLTLQQDGCYLSQALSSADILATLYTRILKLAPLAEPLTSDPFAGVPGSVGGESPSGGRFHGEKTPKTDRFLISPAHYAVAIYAALEVVGRLEPGALETFNTDGTTLEMIGAEHSPGFELTTGSFGQALSQSAGIALSRKLRGETGRTAVFMSDGELEEGQTWEGVQAAAFYKLDRLMLFVDVNGQQVDGWTKDVMNVEPIDARFKAFGWDVAVVDAHDPAAIARPVENKQADGRPLVVLCYSDTTRGVPYLDYRKPLLHYVRPKNDQDVEELTKAMKSLSGVEA